MMISFDNFIGWFNIVVVITESLGKGITLTNNDAIGDGRVWSRWKQTVRYGIILIVYLNSIYSIGVSYNQPRFGSCASWNINATTLANNSLLGSSPYGLFISTNNTLYINARKKNTTQIWLAGATAPSSIFSTNLESPAGIFVTTKKDIYIDNGIGKNQVVMWPFNQTTGVVVMNVSGRCHSLFVDINNTLYCSMGDLHSVVKKSLNDSITIPPTTLAGNGSSGSQANLLSYPYGIFVDINFNLYVADSGNNRIQFFRSGQSNGTALLGNGSTINFALNKPSYVVLDADSYLFIVDQYNNRIIGSGPYGYRCVAGCSGASNTTADTLFHPFSMVFDSYGNIFVVDCGNNRIQKFTLKNNTCVDPTTEKSVLLTSLGIDKVTTTVKQTTIQTSTITPTTGQTSRLTTMTEPSTMQTSIVTTMTEQITTALTIVMMEFTTTTEPAFEVTTTSLSTSNLLTTVKTAISSKSISRQTSITATKPAFFVAPICLNSSFISPSCNLTNNLCDILHPCQNAGICEHQNISNFYTYSCLCINGFNGSNCQYDYRPCTAISCWNNGLCTIFLNTSFSCLCSSGWHGVHCERKKNYCANITCSNNAVCRPLLLGFKCECLTSSYSGRYCEQKANKIIIKEMISKTFAYVAILAIATVLLLVVTLDILKYIFHIDPIHEERNQVTKQTVRIRQTPPIVIRYTYVN